MSQVSAEGWLRRFQDQQQRSSESERGNPERHNRDPDRNSPSALITHTVFLYCLNNRVNTHTHTHTQTHTDWSYVSVQINNRFPTSGRDVWSRRSDCYIMFLIIPNKTSIISLLILNEANREQKQLPVRKTISWTASPALHESSLDRICSCLRSADKLIVVLE